MWTLFVHEHLRASLCPTRLYIIVLVSTSKWSGDVKARVASDRHLVSTHAPTMAESSISVAVRVRPFSAKEAAQLAPQDSYQPFLGDGGLSAGNHASPSKGAGGTGPTLRTRYLRSIVKPVDDKVLIFDPPETPLAGTTGQNSFGHGSKKPRDIRYAFDRVFDDTCGQEMVFANTTKPLLEGILNGFNASVFAYGVRGRRRTTEVVCTDALLNRPRDAARHTPSAGRLRTPV